MEEAAFMSDYSFIRSYGLTLKNISYLSEVVVLVFPYKDQRNALECINQWEEKAVNEVVMMSRVEVIDICHEFDQYLAELILTFSVDAGCL